MLDGVGRGDVREEEKEIWVLCARTLCFCWGNEVGTKRQHLQCKMVHHQSPTGLELISVVGGQRIR